MAWISDYQRWLSESESMQNAQEVANHFTSWSPEAISALCGNMRVESSINPDMYEYGYAWSADRGYGLVQWTPRSKYWDWAVGRGLSPRSGPSQLARIDYEVDNNIQWIDVGYMSFSEFRRNSGNWSVDYLTEAFTWCYERPRADAGQSSMAERKAFANRCFRELDFEGGGGGSVPPGTQLAKLPIDVIYVTQGEFGPISHYAGSGEELAIDFIGYGPNGKIDRYPLYAPFDSEVIDIYPQWAQVWWRNTVDVIGVNEVIYPKGELIHSIIHDWNYDRHSIGDRVSQGDLFHHTGNAGQSSGDHLHLHAINDSVHRYPPLVATQLHIYDLFDTSHVKQIYNSGGYDWKQFTGTIPGPGDGGDGEGGDSKSDIISMLMTNTLTGWYS